jgi:hypothetical protein
MSYTTIHQATEDEALVARVTAAALKEAWASAEYSETEFGKTLRNSPNLARSVFMWPVSIDNEAAYSYAVDSDNPNPGGDPGVISDAAIQAGVQAHWPPDPSTGPPPGGPVIDNSLPEPDAPVP